MLSLMLGGFIITVVILVILWFHCFWIHQIVDRLENELAILKFEIRDNKALEKKIEVGKRVEEEEERQHRNELVGWYREHYTGDKHYLLVWDGFCLKVFPSQLSDVTLEYILRKQGQIQECMMDIQKKLEDVEEKDE